MLSQAPTVVKVGGELLDTQLDTLAESLAALLGPVVLVHGGGAQATALAERLGVPQRKIEGRRITCAETLEIAKMVYRGTLNTNVVAALRAAGVSAVGLSGVDGSLITAAKRPPAPVGDAMVDYGEVGDVVDTNPALLQTLLAAGHVPVVACLAADSSGRVLNINADTVAAALASALRASRLVCVTTAPGILRAPPDMQSIIRQIDEQEIASLCEAGVITDGMLPKVEACLHALRGGVGSAHIVDGRARWERLGENGTQIASPHS